MIIFMIKSVIWFVLHVFWFFPLNTKRIYFSAFQGHQFSCNPKYLYLYILSHNKEGYSFVWEFLNLSKSMLVPDAKVVKSKTLQALVYCLSSKYIITNTEFPWYIPLRKSQILLQTWHGGGAYKKVGIAAGWGAVANLEQKLNSRQIDLYVSSSKKFSEVQSFSKCVPINKFINTGMPRNSFLLDNIIGKRKSILAKISLPDSCKVVLYAPTYRGVPKFNNTRIDTYEYIDYTKLKESLENKFGGAWIVLYRGHYFSSGGSLISNSEVIDVTDYEDMQELLYISDVLVTDYSSSMWDFSLMEKPVLIYANDIDSYDVERGFYTSPYEWPFPFARNNKDLDRNIINFNSKIYIEEVRRYHKNLVSYDCLDSCKKVYDFLGIMTE